MHFSLLLLSIISSVSAQPAQTAQNCSVKGYDSGKHLAFLVNPNITTPVACKAYCAAATYQKCESFAVGGACLLYNVTVNGNVVPMSTSTFTFYDGTCTV